MKRLLAVFGFCLITQATQATPSINIGTVYDYLDGDKSTFLKRVQWRRQHGFREGQHSRDPL
jgi:hypothetical protein